MKPKLEVILLVIACLWPVSTTAQARAATTLQVRVIDSATEMPVANSRIALRSLPSAAPFAEGVADSSGLVRFANTPGGTIHLSIRRIGSVPRDTTLSIVGGVNVAIDVRMESLSTLLAAVQVAAADQCPEGFGRLTREANFASLLLAAVDSQFRAPTNRASVWRVVESRRLIDRKGDDLEWSELEWVTSMPPELKGIARDTLESLGYSWLTESRWHFGLPHPSVFASKEFERLHCFIQSPAAADSSQELRFVPSKRRVPNQLSGRVVFGGYPSTIQRLDLYYRGAPGQFRDSTAYASIAFRRTVDERSEIDGWLVSLPARAPRALDQSVLSPEFTKTAVFDARIEYKTSFYLDSTASTVLSGDESFRVQRKESQSHCTDWSIAQCLTFGIASLRVAMTASDSLGGLAAAGYLAAACGGGPIPVGQPAVHRGESSWVHHSPSAHALSEAKAYLGAYWDHSKPTPARFAKALHGHVQLEACSRLLHVLLADTLLITTDVAREGLADWTCSMGEAASCLEQALFLIRRHATPASDSSSFVAIEQFLRRGCFLRSARACRILASRIESFSARDFFVSRLRGDRSTEPAAKLLKSRAAAFLASSSAPDTLVTSEAAAELRAKLKGWSSTVEFAEYGMGTLLTFHVTDPNRISENLLRPSTEATADSLGAFLRMHPDASALVVVHSDSAWLPTGSLTKQLRDRQIRRSEERRAEAWNQRLVGAGAGRNQIHVYVAGDSEPLFSNLSRLGQQLNRRVEIAIRFRQVGSNGEAK